jgi:hypothetical protein
MSIVKLESAAPVFLVEEIQSSPTDDCIFLLLNSQEVTIIREALFPVASWHTRLGRWVGVGRFEWVEDTSIQVWFKGLVDSIDYKLSGDDMTTCFEDIKIGLLAIAQALGEKCDTGCGEVTVNVTSGGNTVTGIIDGGPGELEGEGNPPEGFDTWGEYYLHKCRVANAIVDGFISYLNIFSVTTAVEFVKISAVLGLCWAAFPPAGVAFLVFALVALALGRMYLSQLATYISNNRDDFICAIFRGKTTGEAIDFFFAEIDDGIESLSLAAPLPGLVRQVVNAMADGSVFAKLYDIGFEVFYPDADCSLCAYEDCFGNLDPSWPSSFTWESENVLEITTYLLGGYYGITFGSLSLKRELVSLEVVSGTFNCGYTGYFYCAGDGTRDQAITYTNPATWWAGQTSIAGFETFFIAYQQSEMTFRLTFADLPCLACVNETDSEPPARETNPVAWPENLPNPNTSEWAKDDI